MLAVFETAAAGIFAVALMVRWGLSGVAAGRSGWRALRLVDGVLVGALVVSVYALARS